MPLGKAMQDIAISQGSLSSHISDFLIIKRKAGKLSMNWIIRVGVTGFEPAT